MAKLRTRAVVQTVSSFALCLSLVPTGCIGKRRPAAAAGARQAPRPSNEAAAVALDPNAVDDKLSDLVTGERVQVVYDATDPQKGAATPKVTIVEFSDFQCPFCSKLAASLEQVLAENPEDVRLVFKQFPLPMHADAEPGARAALAAGKQGKHWEMHDKLFANQRAMKPADIERYAQEIGLDMAAFKRDLDSPEIKARVARDLAQGRALEVRSTPTFFVNGRVVTGAQPVEQIKAVVDEENQLAQKLIAAGSAPAEVYARIIRTGRRVEVAAEPEIEPDHQRGEASKIPNYAIPVGENRPSAGPEDALVTIIAYTSYDSAASRQANATLGEIRKRHPDVRVVFHQLPNPDSEAAVVSALAALAAHRQGKFLAMHDAMLAAEGSLTPPQLARIAARVGLDGQTFMRDMRDTELNRMLAEDQAMVDRFRGTATAPIFFVNGRFMRDTPSHDQFEALMLEEHAKAEKFANEQKISDRTQLFEAMRKTWRGYDIAERPLPTEG